MAADGRRFFVMCLLEPSPPRTKLNGPTTCSRRTLACARRVASFRLRRLKDLRLRGIRAVAAVWHWLLGQLPSCSPLLIRPSHTLWPPCSAFTAR
jgi:hypothetical protein